MYLLFDRMKFTNKTRILYEKVATEKSAHFFLFMKNYIIALQ